MSAISTAAAGTTLFLARHGQSESNNQALITGQLDVGLSPKGQAQAQALSQILLQQPLAAIYASGLRRTVETAQPTATAQAMAIERLPGLNEIGLGVLEGRHRDERDPEAQALWAQWQADLWHFRVPGGERFDEFAGRVQAALETILARHAGQAVLVVGHRATNRVLLGRLLAWPRERWIDIRPRNKHLYRLDLGSAPPAVATCTLGGSKSGRWQAGFIM